MRHHVMRRSATMLTTALLAVTALGCAPERPHGVLVVATQGDPTTLFPPFARAAIEQALSSQIYYKLADVGPSLNTVGDSGFVPEIAESWEFRDPTTLVFRLDPDARWHDGASVTAGDVAFTFDLYRDTLVGASQATLLSRIRSVEAEDDRTVVFRFASSYPAQFYDAVYHMRILPAHRLDTIPRGTLRGHPAVTQPVGSGPYRLARWLPGELTELEAVPDWWGGAIGPERVIVRVTPDLQTAVGQLIAGEAQVVDALPTPDVVARVRESENAEVLRYPTSAYAYLGFNLDRPPFGDRRLRQALVLAVDRQAIIDALLDGRGIVPAGPVTPAVWISHGATGQPAADPAESRRILDSLGWRDTNGDGIRERGGRALRFEVAYPAQSGLRAQTSIIMERQFNDVGVGITLVPMEQNAWLDAAQRGQFDAIVGGWQIDMVPDAMRELWGAEGIGGLNYGRYRSAAFDSLVHAASLAENVTAARALWHEALVTINADAPALWLFTPELAAGVSVGLENVSIRPDNWAATLRDWRLPR